VTLTPRELGGLEHQEPSLFRGSELHRTSAPIRSWGIPWHVPKNLSHPEGS
jgi:hypothetical protein